MSPKSTLSEDDKALFQDVMRTVKPLKPGKKVAAEHIQVAKKPIIKPPPEPPSLDYPKTALSSYYAEPVNSDSILYYCKTGFPKKQLLHAHKQQPWQARLDLHGLRPETAQAELCNFIAQQLQSQHRYVLVIHGKGGRFGEAPVLKNLVNRWLQQLPEVLAFHSAVAKDGGSGAVYIILQRAKI
jgi:DNA-nicking Smr family endonuclease